MTQLTDTIAAFGADNLLAALRADADFGVLNLMFDSPEEIIPALNDMGFGTVDQVLEWVQNVNFAIKSPATFVRLVDPDVPIKLDGMAKTDMPTIHKAIVTQTAVRPDFFIDQSDATYHLPTKAQWDQLAALCPVSRRKWVNEIMDCDDYVNVFRGWLASHGLGNTANAFCGLTMYDSAGNLMGGHAVVLVMDDTHKLWFLEPQNGKLYEPTYAKLGGMFFAKTVKIARAYF